MRENYKIETFTIDGLECEVHTLTESFNDDLQGFACKLDNYTTTQLESNVGTLKSILEAYKSR